MPRRVHPAPQRGPHVEDARQSVALLGSCAQTVHVVLVALTDGVEVEVHADGSLRRRLRFLRDGEARKYTDRLVRRLQRRGYRQELEPK